jgi:hypothetical protein
MPVAKGISAIAIVAPDQSALCVSEAGEFATARNAEPSYPDTWFRNRLKQLAPPRD